MTIFKRSGVVLGEQARVNDKPRKEQTNMNSILVALSISIATLAFANTEAVRYGAVPQTEAQEARTVPFADFDAQFEMDTKFEVRGGFSLGASSNGINLFKENVSFEVGGLSKTIPAGAFKEEKRGKISYSEATEDFIGDVTIRIVGDNKFTVKIEGVSAKVAKDTKPGEITLRIGDDEGRARERVKTEKKD